MQLKDQVCSLELSKQLKELGVKQISYFYWNATKKNTNDHELNINFERWWLGRHSLYEKDNIDFEIAAFTVAELGEMLPATMLFEKHRNGEWVCIDNINPIGLVSHPKEADSRAKILIYLLENKLMELPNE